MQRGPFIAMLISAAATATIVAGIHFAPNKSRRDEAQKKSMNEETGAQLDQLMSGRIIGCDEIIGHRCSKYDDGLKSNCTAADGADAFLCCATSVPDEPSGRWLECGWNDEDGVVGCNSIIDTSCEERNAISVCAEGANDYLVLRCGSLGAGRTTWIRSPLPSCDEHENSPCVRGDFLCTREDSRLDRLCCMLDRELGERSYLPCQ